MPSWKCPSFVYFPVYISCNLCSCFFCLQYLQPMSKFRINCDVPLIYTHIHEHTLHVEERSRPGTIWWRWVSERQLRIWLSMTGAEIAELLKEDMNVLLLPPPPPIPIPPITRLLRGLIWEARIGKQEDDKGAASTAICLQASYS